MEDFLNIFLIFFQCKGFWPIANQKRMQMIAKVTEKSLQTLPFYFTEAHSTLLALPAEVRLIKFKTHQNIFPSVQHIINAAILLERFLNCNSKDNCFSHRKTLFLLIDL